MSVIDRNKLFVEPEYGSYEPHQMDRLIALCARGFRDSNNLERSCVRQIRAVMNRGRALRVIVAGWHWVNVPIDYRGRERAWHELCLRCLSAALKAPGYSEEDQDIVAAQMLSRMFIGVPSQIT